MLSYRARQRFGHAMLTSWQTRLSRSGSCTSPRLIIPIGLGHIRTQPFALAFAIDYARSRGDQDFEQALLQKARELHASDRHVPAEWEPNATDFFSPSLMVADLMTRVLPQREYVRWLSSYFLQQG